MEICGATTEGNSVAPAAPALRPSAERNGPAAPLLMGELKFAPTERFVASSGMGPRDICGGRQRSDFDNACAPGLPAPAGQKPPAEDRPPWADKKQGFL